MLEIADLMLTLAVVTVGGGTELNPVFGHILESSIGMAVVAKVVIPIIIAVILVQAAKHRPTLILWTLIGIITIMTAVCIWNIGGLLIGG